MAARKKRTTTIATPVAPKAPETPETKLKDLIEEAYYDLRTARWRAESLLNRLKDYSARITRATTELSTCAVEGVNPSLFGVDWVKNYTENLVETTAEYQARFEEIAARKRLLRKLLECATFEVEQVIRDIAAEA